MMRLRCTHWIFKGKRSFSSELSVGNETDLIRVTEEDGVRRIVMIDKATMNSMRISMTNALSRHINARTNDPKLRCIVISSSGPTFSAGENLEEIASSNGRQVFHRYGKLMMSIVKCPVPVLTAIDGLAASAGCQLVAQSDIAICSPASTFSTPGANFGIFSCIPTVPLSRCVHKQVAFYMLMTGKTITAEEALRAGLVSLVSPEEKLSETVDNVVQTLKSKSRVVLEYGKKFFYDQMELGITKAYKKGAKMMDFSLTFVDGIEGLRSVAEKREPKWKHTPYL